MTHPIKVLEHIVRRAPLAMRFRDVVTDKPITDGLEVRAYAMSHLQEGYLAQRSPVTGIYGYRTLPGLSAYVDGSKEANQFCVAVSPDANFIVSIEDTQRRFLPQLMSLCLPKETLLNVPIFSSPTRNLAGAYAEIRGYAVYEKAPATLIAANWAIIEVTLEGATYITITAPNGEFVCYVPYPPIKSATGSNNKPLSELSWSVSIRAQFEPDTLDPVFPNGSLVLPDISAITNQGNAKLFEHTNQTAKNKLNRDLIYGAPLVVRSKDQSYVQIDPA